MFRNYLIAALRNLARNKLYTAINILGLAVGFAAATLIALFIRYEVTFDRQWPDHERIQAVFAELTLPNFPPRSSNGAPIDVGRRLKAAAPEGVLIARLEPLYLPVGEGEREYNELVHFADADFFSIFRMQPLAGSLENALQNPDGVVLSERMARKYFGRSDPVGETLRIDRSHPMKIAAVIRDLPRNTHIGVDILLSGRAAFSPLTLADAEPWPPKGISFATNTFLKLPPGFSPSRLSSELDALGRAYLDGASKTAQFGVRLHLVPITQVHLASPTTGTKPTTVLYAASLIGLLIVMVAAINFVTLMTARASRRATEIGVRKTSGAETVDLMKQFIGESIIYALIAAVMALALVELVLPRFNDFLFRDITLRYVRDSGFIACLLGAAILVGALAGVYPALVLTRFKPASVLKGDKLLTSGSGAVRQALVVVQFAVLIALIFAAGVIYRQINFALNEGLRVDKDQVLAVTTSCAGSFVTEVRKLPGVRGAVCSAGAPFGTARSSGGALAANGTQITIESIAVEPGFFEFYGIRPVAGRVFSTRHAADVGAKGGNGTFIGPIILNDIAVRQLQLGTHEAAIGQVLRNPPGRNNRGIESEIVGVVRDFPTSNLHDPLSAKAFHTDAGVFNLVSIRLVGQQIPETLRAIDQLWKRTGEPRPIQRFFADQFYQDQYAEDIRQGKLIGGFAGVAVFIACLGLFGLSAFTAERRTKEIGVRKAMGASRSDIVRMLIWQFTRPVLWANLIAWPACYFIMHHWLEGFAYRVELAPWMFLAAGATAVAIAWLTVSAHAIAVARARPVTALRHE